MNLMDLKQQLVRIMKTPVNERWDPKLEGGFILGLLFHDCLLWSTFFFISIRRKI